MKVESNINMIHKGTRMMYEDIIKVLELNFDELEKLLELLEETECSSIAEQLLIEGLIDKLIE